MFRSIRHGLFAALAGFTVLLCVGYTGLALIISYVTEDMLVDRLLEREATAVTAQFRSGGDIQSTGNDLIHVYRDAGALPPVVRAQVTAGREHGEILPTPASTITCARSTCMRRTAGGGSICWPTPARCWWCPNCSRMSAACWSRSRWG